ncbi:unnamed protein product [Paramecium pentaurelia]|uniref:Protein kinase domain-containing protein n=1 Tax=Paramecium pentaurelia TaxID=43138 RepID=A0A8S1TWV3_9CILI|nr:unnamed protein product [Paramecium pentaurelia]
MINPNVGNSIFIEGNMFTRLQQTNMQGPQLNNDIVHLIGNPKQLFILKQYNKIRTNEIQILRLIKGLQNEEQSKCQNIIKIIGIQEKQIQNQLTLQVILEKSEDNCENLISAKTISLVQKLNIFEQMVKGVIQLQELSCYLKDLKPENFVYFQDNNNNYVIKLIEFGFLNQESNLISQIKSLKYIAPEVLITQGNYNINTTNIWSLGIILYQIVSSQHFFQSMNQQELIQQINSLTQEQINSKINQILNIGQPEKDLISSMLQKESQHRLKLQSVLEQIQINLPIIKEQEETRQLKFVKEQYLIFLRNAKQKNNLQAPQIKLISEQFKFYQFIYKQFQGQGQISNLIKRNQDISETIQQIEQQESSNQQFDSRQHEITVYKEFNEKLKQCLYDFDNSFKNSIRDANQFIQRIDKDYMEFHNRQIRSCKEQLTKQSEKFQQFSNLPTYANIINQVNKKIEEYFVQLTNLEQLIIQRTQQAYQKYEQIYKQIQQQLVDFYQENDENVKKILLSIQIEKKKEEWRKNQDQVQAQWKICVDNTPKLKQQMIQLINNPICQSLKKVIDEKFLQLDQEISENENLFNSYKNFNQFNCVEAINWQIQILESFQKKLKELYLNQTIQVGQLQSYSNNVQELQKKYTLFQQATQSINCKFPNYQYFIKIHQENEKHHQQLEQEIKVLQEYLMHQNENEQLFIEALENMKTKKQSQKKLEIEKRISKNQEINKQQGQILSAVLQKVSKLQSELKFTVQDHNLIMDQEQLNILNNALQNEINMMNQKISNQIFSIQQLTQQMIEISKLNTKIDDQMKRIPQKQIVEDFINKFQQNQDSYEKQYALVNYIKLYHLTRYINRIKQKPNIMDQVEITKYEKETKGLLQNYENYLFNNKIQIKIEEMEINRKELEQQLEKLEKKLEQQNYDSLSERLKFEKQIIETQWNNQFYKITDFTQMIRLNKIKTEIQQVIQEKFRNQL